MVKHRTLIYLVVSLLASAFIVPSTLADRGIIPVPNRVAEKIKSGQNWLFVIGINKYDKWPTLKSAVNDAKSLKKILISRYYFDDEHTIELYNKEATREGILEKLRYLATNVKKDDSVLIFYAGHGHIDPITKVGHWIPVESETKNTASYLSNFDVKSYLKIGAIKAKHILLISDSCFAGEFFRSYRNAPVSMATKKYIKNAYNLPSRMAITSGGLEPVSDDGFAGNSVFTYYLLTALKANDHPFLLPSEIFPKIKEGVTENASQFPRFGNIAGTGGQQGGEMVFFLKRDISLEYESSLLNKQKQIEELEKLDRAEKLENEKRSRILKELEARLAELDKKILGLKEDLDQKGIETSGDLDVLYKLVKEKEANARNIAELKYKRRYEEVAKLFEITKLRSQSALNLDERLRKDLKKYLEISNSRFGNEFKTKAWNALSQKYTDYLSNLKTGDTQKLLARLKFHVDGEVQAFKKEEKKLNYLNKNKEILILGHLENDAVVDSIVNSGKMAGQKNTLELKSSATKIYLSKHTPPEILSDIKKTLGTEDIENKIIWSRKGEIIVSESSKLMWMAKDYRNITGSHPLNWNAAKGWASKINEMSWGGHDDWRLPTIDELRKLYTQERKVQSFTGKSTLGYPIVVDDGPGYFLVSSDTFDDDLVWAFGFYSGTASVVRKDTGYVFGSVRLVR
jgi:hypothetical protein